MSLVFIVIFFVVVVRIVFEFVIAEAVDDVVDVVGVGEERGVVFRFSFGCGRKEDIERGVSK